MTWALIGIISALALAVAGLVGALLWRMHVDDDRVTKLTAAEEALYKATSDLSLSEWGRKQAEKQVADLADQITAERARRDAIDASHVAELDKVLAAAVKGADSPKLVDMLNDLMDHPKVPP